MKITNSNLESAVLEDVAYDSKNIGAYIVGQDGIFGYYDLSANTTSTKNLEGINFVDVEYDGSSFGAYLAGNSFDQQGTVFYYNKTSDSTTSLFSGGTLKAIALDTTNNGIYAAGQQGFLVYHDLNSGSTNHIYSDSQIDILSIVYDSINDGIYFAARTLQGNLSGEKTLGYYSRQQNEISYLGHTDSKDFIGNSDLNLIVKLAYDTRNDGLYLTGSNGLFAYYSRLDNTTTDLRNTDSSNWISDSGLWTVAYDEASDGVYLSGSSGVIGHYRKSSGITIDLTNTDDFNWMGQLSPEIVGLDYDNHSKGVYFLGNDNVNDFGFFGHYSLISLAPMAIGDDVVATFDSLSVSFDNIESSGVTTVVNSSVSFAPSTGFSLNGTYYNISTTAKYSGLITVRLPYNPSVENPLLLRMYHYDSILLQWVDVTVAVDTENKTVIGIVSSLSPFAVGIPELVVDLRQPINKSSFNLGSAVPIKFKLSDTAGNIVSAANARLFVSKDAGEQMAPSINSNSNQFRYNNGEGLYVFNLDTKKLSPGQWKGRIDVEGKEFTLTINLSEKKSKG